MGKEDEVVDAVPSTDTAEFMLKVAAQIAIVCASLMLFFHFYSENIYVATLWFVLGAIIGSIICWKNMQAARALFFLAVLAIEWVVVKRISPSLLPFFVFGDVFLLAFLAYGYAKGEKAKKQK